MSTATRALVVISFLVALGSVTALVVAIATKSVEENSYLTGPFVSIDEVSSDHSSFDGKKISVICYLWPGMEGLGLSTIPTGKRWVYDKEWKRNVCQGNYLLAKCTVGWDYPLWDTSSVQNAYQTGDTLVVVEGVFHKSNYGPAGSMLDDSPYIQVESCRPVIRVGGRLPNSVMEKN